MFKFDRDNPSKIVATSLIPIVPCHSTHTMIWTPGLKEFYTRRVFLIFTLNKKGRQVIRFYPLQKRKDKAPPAFAVVPNNSPYLDKKTTHLCFNHQNFKIIRPIRAVYYKTKWALDNQNLDYLPANLLTLLKHCYFTDLVEDEFINEMESKFEKLEKIIAKAENNSEEEEIDTALRIALSLCRQIFDRITEKIKKEVGHVQQ